MVKFCPECGKENQDNAAFCQGCGEDIKNVKPVKSSPSNERTTNQTEQQNSNKKWLGLAGICCIGLILIIAVSGMFSPDKTTATNTSSNNSVSPTSSTSSNDTSSSSGSGVQVKVDYAGSWSGAYGDESGTQSVDGSGTKTIDMTGNPSIVSANFQKKDSSSGTLTVEIIKDGNVIETKSTSAEYGVASVSANV